MEDSDLDFRHFVDILRDELDIDLPYQRSARLVEDLSLDSLSIYELSLIINEVESPASGPEHWIDMLTLGQAELTLGAVYELSQHHQNKIQL
jgi:hypothetical protein